MRNRLAMLLVVIALAGCGGAGTGSTTKPGPTAKTPATSAAGGAVDCAAIKSAATELISIQLLAQLRTPDAIESIKTQAMGSLDVDDLLGALHTLHTLDGHASVLGDPKAAIDFYEKAANAAKVLFATEPMTQAAIDTYNQNVGTVADFLGHQAAISGAMGEAGC